jgi:predicted DCC family thiol-disulfide oxidoreductase YuxK
MSCGEVRDGVLTVGRYLKPMTEDMITSVLYNAQCPVCSAEIGHYARYAGEAGLPIRFDDLNIDAWGQFGLDYDKAARRLYVHHDGVLTSGIPAFLVLWAQMPRYRLLGKLLGLPGIRQLASAAYDYFFAPAIYHAHVRRLRKASAGTAD